MLAGNRVKCDELYSYADVSKLHEERPQQPDTESSNSSAKRNSRTRKAFKQSKSLDNDCPVYSDPIEMGNNEGHPTVDLTGVTSSPLTGNDRELPERDGYDYPRKKSVDRKHSRKEVRLGDYTEPIDFKVEDKSGIPSPISTDYSEPYEAKQLKSIERKSTKRREDIYEFAGPRTFESHVTDKRDSPAVNERKLSDRSDKEVICENLKQNQVISVSGTSLDSGVEDPEHTDDYDHLTTWGSRKDSQKSDNYGQSVAVNSRNMSSQQTESRNAIYAGAYEEPWDSRNSQQQFNDVLEQAESQFSPLSPQCISDNPKSVLSTKAKDYTGAVYEEAWDAPHKQKELEEKIQQAQRKKSQTNELTFVQPKGSNSAVSPKSEQVYAGNYEDPWDSKEKEAELEEKLNKASLHSPTGDKPPAYNAPPPPQTYEEAWDVRPSSKVIGKVAGSKDTSPSSGSNDARPDSSRISIQYGEKIDPGLPLDIQKFYHGSISRKAAEDLLLVHREGSYLIRRSETNKNVFSLSLKGVGGLPMHIRISLLKGEYVLGENSQPFPTVPEMIDYFTRHELPVYQADRIKLLFPVQRNMDKF